MSSPETDVTNSTNGVDVLALLEALWRSKILVGCCVIIGAAFALYLAYSTPNTYEATIVVTPVSDSNGGETGGLASRLGGLASLAGINVQGGSGTTLESQATLNSRYLAESFIQRYQLTPTLLGSSPRQSLWLAVDKFRRTVLKVAQDKEKGTTIVTVRWKDPALAARWANEYIALTNEILRRRALDEAGRNVKFLNEQISKTSVVEIQRVLYGLVENQTKNQMLASTRVEYAFSVVDPAVTPEERVWPRRSIMLLTGIGAGLIIGVVIALLRDAWRRRPAVPGA